MYMCLCESLIPIPKLSLRTEVGMGCNVQIVKQLPQT